MFWNFWQFYIEPLCFCGHLYTVGCQCHVFAKKPVFFFFWIWPYVITALFCFQRGKRGTLPHNTPAGEREHSFTTPILFRVWFADALLVYTYTLCRQIKVLISAPGYSIHFICKKPFKRLLMQAICYAIISTPSSIKIRMFTKRFTFPKTIISVVSCSFWLNLIWQKRCFFKH